MKRIAVFVALFFIPALATFLIWPIEKADYSKCNGNLFCGAEFKSVPGGGAIFLTNLGKVRDTKPEKTSIKQFDKQEERANYSFSPILVAAVANIVGLGSLAVGGIIYRKIRRDRQEPE